MKRLGRRAWDLVAGPRAAGDSLGTPRDLSEGDGIGPVARSAQETPEAELSDALAALSNPVRIALLRRLQSPKALREIDVEHPQGDPEGRSRPLARQTVKEHLEKLVPVGIVSAKPAERDYGETIEYVVNHQRVFAIAEALRELAKIRPAQEPTGHTVQRPAPPTPFKIQGPCLVLVKGLDEGRTFQLAAPRTGPKTWTIGRRRGSAIPLDFDPFVSTENAAVLWDGAGYFVQDLPESRNGTTLNFQDLPKGGRQPLATGDLIGVGRSLLMFRA